jgi:hypothetical protein
MSLQECKELPEGLFFSFNAEIVDTSCFMIVKLRNFQVNASKE